MHAFYPTKAMLLCDKSIALISPKTCLGAVWRRNRMTISWLRTLLILAVFQAKRQFPDGEGQNEAGFLSFEGGFNL